MILLLYPNRMEAFRETQLVCFLEKVNKAKTLCVAGSIAARISLLAFLAGAVYVMVQGQGDSDACATAGFIFVVGAIINIPTYFVLSNKSKLLNELSRNIELNYSLEMVSGYIEKIVKSNNIILYLNSATIMGMITVVLTIVQILSCVSIKNLYAYYTQMKSNNQL